MVERSENASSVDLQGISENGVEAHVHDLDSIMKLLPALDPGDECFVCHRPVPKVRSDSEPGPARSVVSIHEPRGEEGTLDALMIAVVDKYKDAFPREHATMRHNIGLEVVGGRSWKYHVAHFALYAVLNVPGLEPTEEGA